MSGRSAAKYFIVDQMRAMSDVVYNALKKDEIETLKGAQAFALTLWGWTYAGSALISHMIRRTIEERKKKREERRRWEREKYEITPEEKEELSSDKIWLDLNEIRYEVRGLKTASLFVKGLKEKGFIEFRDVNPPEYKGSPMGIQISLTDVWNTVLERIERDREEVGVFSEDIGRVLSLSILADLKSEGALSFCGKGRFKSMAILVMKAKDDTTPIPLDDVKEAFGGSMNYTRVRSYDNRRDPSVRFIKSEDGRNVFITNNAIRVYKLFRKIGLRLTRKRM